MSKATQRGVFHKRLDEEYPFFARHLLKIKTKSGELMPFVFNKAQNYLHARAEKQIKTLGRVRLIIVKGRQQGCSTYIGGRGYKKATREHNKSAFILSHLGDTTGLLFNMVETYHENIPDSAKPNIDIANRKMMRFKSVNSDYRVGTAGSDNVGRGGTVQFFHGSEVAFWEKVDNIQTGVLQSVADIDGTEIFLESTANGMGNAFYTMTMEAVKGESDYEVVFIPWYWQEEYTRAVPSNGRLEFSDEERKFRETIANLGSEFSFKLTDGQIYWRRSKMAELKSDWMFKQEYPSSLLEAFQTTGETFIKAQMIVEARNSTVTDKGAPLIMGVDPARTRDRIIFSYRRGRQFMPHEEFSFSSNEETIQMQIVGLIVDRIRKLDPQKVFIDIGEGWGIVDRLKELGYGQICQGIQFGSKATDPETYLNKRAEMWGTLKDFLHKEEGEVSIPDDDEVQTDLASMPKEIITSSSKIQMVDKKTIRKNTGLSPDIGDAMALTFAYPVRKIDSKYSNNNKYRRKDKSGSALSTLARQRRYNSGSNSSTRKR